MSRVVITIEIEDPADARAYGVGACTYGVFATIDGERKASLLTGSGGMIGDARERVDDEVLEAVAQLVRGRGRWPS